MGPSLSAALHDLRSPRQAARRQAASLLGAASPDEAQQAVEALRGALDDPDDDVRYAATLALAQLGSAAGPALDALIAALERDASDRVRQGAATALGELGQREAIDALLRATAQPSAGVRFQLPAALCLLGNAQQVGPALTSLLDDPDPEVRAAAAAALGDLNAQGSRQPLLARLQDIDEDVRFEASLALARLGERTGAVELTHYLRHREYRFAAARQLCEHPLAELRSAIEQQLRRWLTPPLLKVYLAGALARLGDADGTARLQKLARHSQAPVRGLSKEILQTVREA